MMILDKKIHAFHVCDVDFVTVVLPVSGLKSVDEDNPT